MKKVIHKAAEAFEPDAFLEIKCKHVLATGRPNQFQEHHP